MVYELSSTEGETASSHTAFTKSLGFWLWLTGPFESDDPFYAQSNHSAQQHSEDSDSDESRARNPWNRPVHYVYDAAAERTQQRIREGRLAAAALVGGVH